MSGLQPLDDQHYNLARELEQLRIRAVEDALDVNSESTACFERVQPSQAADEENSTPVDLSLQTTSRTRDSQQPSCAACTSQDAEHQDSSQTAQTTNCLCQQPDVFGAISNQSFSSFASLEPNRAARLQQGGAWFRRTCDAWGDSSVDISDLNHRHVDRGNALPPRRSPSPLNLTDLRDEVKSLDAKLPTGLVAAQTEPRSSTCAEEARMDLDYTVEDLAGYVNELMYIPRNMSDMAEMMYT